MKLSRKAKAQKRMNAKIRREKDPKRRIARLEVLIDAAMDKRDAERQGEEGR